MQSLYKKWEVVARKPSEGEIVRVENESANNLLIAARKGQRLQDFMDSVSGIEGYSLKNLSRQGHIRSMFSKELISAQFLIDFEDIISVFWQGVFEHLDRAKLFGEIVEIKKPGKKKEKRPTNNNPIHWLRYQGRMAARNHISYLYRRNLDQSCTECGHRSTIKADKQCPICPGIMSSVYKFSNVDDEKELFANNTGHRDVENNDVGVKINSMLDTFAKNELKEGTRAYQILKILVDPSASTEMCSACGLCDAKTFDIDECTNYNANIGKWLGVNKTMIASKIRRIRNALPTWLRQQNKDEAEILLTIIPEKFKAFR